MNYFAGAYAFVLLLTTTFASFAQTLPPPLPSTSPNQQRTAPMSFGLTDGTPVKLRIGRTMSSADAKTSETVDFEVLEDVLVGGIVVITHGSTALATVAEAKPKGRMGRGGKLNIVLDSVKLVSGEKIPLKASKDSKGSNSTGAMTGAIVATSILFFPAAPLFLFMKGKDIVIPKGTEITAYVAGDIPLDTSRFSANSDGTVGLTTASNTNLSFIDVKSDPIGADIELDGNYVGNAPSTIQVKAGEHKLVIKKAGYTPWERTIMISSSGTVNVSAQLDKLP